MPDMTFMQMAEGLKVGDVVLSTGVLEAFPSHVIGPGARFVVVGNELTTGRASPGALMLRLAPDDAHLLSAGGDLTDWGNCHVVYDPYELGYEDEPGTPEGDRGHHGSAWNTASECVEMAPDALTLPERIAAVFAARLFEDLDEDDMARVVARNAAESRPDVCHSHDFCDANVVMHAAFTAMGVKAPVDCDEAGQLVGPEFERASALWSDAWGIARSSWLVAPSRADPEDEPGHHP